MICGNCKHYNRDNAVICRYCGARLADDSPDVEDFFPQIKKNNVSPVPRPSQPKSKDFSDEYLRPVVRNVSRGINSQRSENLKEAPVSEVKETSPAKEKSSASQDQSFNKKFTSALILLSIIILVCMIAFSYSFIGKYKSFSSAHYSAVPTAAPTVTATRAPSPTPVPTTKPDS